ncbi:gamma-glutamyl-gamma-aminobutyrate hydrolase family protein [Selenomonadales bacterium OttesenSCG-928-I06]|nr:gamma-glutamyl-gamma-aminobutyrate hydrolase family protein [Selenomonadales bacterium OttesenSCG-928-I06]
MPIIGMTASPGVVKEGIHIGYSIQFLYDSYISSVEQAGGTPLILPTIKPLKMIKQYASAIDGLILTGGGDINPILFGEEPIPELGEVEYDRDIFEIELVRLVLAKKKPVLAICRGVQILNVACGGTLYQDLNPTEFRVQHKQKTTGDFASHTVYIKNNTILQEIFGEKVATNSFHHQGIKDVANGFKVAARSEDGVVEAIEYLDKDNFVVGVQWHPERMTEKHDNMLSLFKKFVEAVK